MITGNELLSFEEFIRDQPRSTAPTFNNFFHFFLPGEWGEMYRKRPIFLRFQKAYPKLCQQLMDCILKVTEDEKFEQDLKGVLQPHFRLLYKGYCSMHPLVMAEDLQGCPGKNDLLFS